MSGSITEVKTTVENETTVHAVDVVYDPECERIAHSLIIVNPEYPDVANQQKKGFQTATESPCQTCHSERMDGSTNA